MMVICLNDYMSLNIFVLGNMRSALNDATAAKKLKPDHIKAILRGISCKPNYFIHAIYRAL